MELIALLLLAPLVFSTGSPDVDSPAAVDVAARVVKSEAGTVVHPPVDARYTMVVLRHTPLGTAGRNPAGSGPVSSLANRVEVIVSAP